MAFDSIMNSIIDFKDVNRDDIMEHVFHFIEGPGGTGKSALFKKLHAACRQNGQLISICAATSLAAFNFDGATTAHSLFSYPVEDETDVDDQDLATCDFNKERCDYLHEVSVIFWDEFISNDRILLWKQSWKNSKRDGKNHVITFSCALVILLRYVFSQSQQTFTSHQYS